MIMPEIDWVKAERYLKVCEEMYTEIGSSGLFAMQMTITPLRDRFNKGDRSGELYDDLFEDKL